MGLNHQFPGPSRSLVPFRLPFLREVADFQDALADGVRKNGGIPMSPWVVSILSHGLMTWMIWGTRILGNLQIDCDRF